MNFSSITRLSNLITKKRSSTTITTNIATRRWISSTVTMRRMNMTMVKKNGCYYYHSCSFPLMLWNQPIPSLLSTKKSFHQRSSRDGWTDDNGAGGAGGSGGGDGRHLEFTTTIRRTLSSSSSLMNSSTSSATTSTSQSKKYPIFNPYKYPTSAALLKLTDDRELLLSPQEVELKLCLQEYCSQQDFSIQKQSQPPTNTPSDVTVLPDMELMDALYEAYMAMEYWEEALAVEEMKYHYYLCDDDDDDDDTDSDNDNASTIGMAAAHSIHHQGKLWLRLGNFERSKPLYEQALQYFQNQQFVQTKQEKHQQQHQQQLLECKIQEGHVLISLAGWYYFQFQAQQDQQPSADFSSSTSSSSSSSLLQTALEYLQRAEPLLETHPTLLVKCIDNQGLIYRLQGDFLSALDIYQQGLQVVHTGDVTTKRALQLHIGDMMLALNDRPQETLQYYEVLLQELKEEQENHNKLQQHPSFSTSPFSNRKTSNDNNNNNYMNNDEDNNNGDTTGMQGVIWHNLGTLYIQLGQYSLAENAFRESLRLKEESAGSDDHPELAKTWNALGALYYGVMENELHQALHCFRTVLWIARSHSLYANPRQDPEILAAIQTISDIEEQINRGR